MSAAAARSDPGSAAPDHAAKGFRPGSRRRARIAAGTAIAAVAIGGNVLLYASLDDRTEVLQLVNDVRAGEQLAADDLRIVAVDVDPSVPVMTADELPLVVDQHARVHLSSGTLLSPLLVQPTPLVSSEAAVVAVELRPTLVPSGVRERSRVELVLVSDDGESRAAGRAVTRPAEVDGVSGLVTMSVEVSVDDAGLVAAADEVRVVLLEPGTDPVYDEGEG